MCLKFVVGVIVIGIISHCNSIAIIVGDTSINITVIADVIFAIVVIANHLSFWYYYQYSSYYRYCCYYHYYCLIIDIIIMFYIWIDALALFGCVKHITVIL